VKGRARFETVTSSRKPRGKGALEKPTKKETDRDSMNKGKIIFADREISNTKEKALKLTTSLR